MKIHEKFKKYHSKSAKPKLCKGTECGDWISCGPHGCCLNENIIPCLYCEFWTGYGLTTGELDKYVNRLEMIAKKQEV